MKNASKNGSSPSNVIPAGSAEANKEPNIKFALKVAVSLGAGMVFGFAAEKGRGEQPVNDTTDPANTFACRSQQITRKSTSSWLATRLQQCNYYI